MRKMSIILRKICIAKFTCNDSSTISERYYAHWSQCGSQIHVLVLNVQSTWPILGLRNDTLIPYHVELWEPLGTIKKYYIL